MWNIINMQRKNNVIYEATTEGTHLTATLPNHVTMTDIIWTSRHGVNSTAPWIKMLYVKPKTLWPESATEISANFADRECHVVSVSDP
jgi:hypothetical protein